jgi:hypothetical protein
VEDWGIEWRIGGLSGGGCSVVLFLFFFSG